MSDKLYTIPVNEAFGTDCECPVCLMYKNLQDAAIEFTLGPSYMEDDVRMATNRLGFCARHVKQLYGRQNRLGLALMMMSHMDRVNAELEKAAKKNIKPAGLFAKEKPEALGPFSEKLGKSCFICERVDETFDRYIATIYYLYNTDSDFVRKFKASKGFCLEHFCILYDRAVKELGASKGVTFREELNGIYFENMRRVREDLQGFVDKFDYRNADKPWGNSRDALIRTILKINSEEVE
jgi:hypothetical protein